MKKDKRFGKRSENIKEKMRKNHLDFSGTKNPFYNKHHSVRTKRKIGNANKCEDSTQGARNFLYAQYKSMSKRRRYLNFNLSKEDFSLLTSSDCFYCGIQPTRVIKYRVSVYMYNGIDRMNNNIGYIMDNCVPCCSRCNYMKLTSSVEDFLAQVTRIYKHQKIKSNDTITS